MTDEVKQAVEEVGKVVHELRAHVEESAKQTRADVLDELKKANIEAGFAEVRARQDELEKSLKRAAVLNDAADADLATRVENEAYRKWVRTGQVQEGLTIVDQDGKHVRSTNMNTLVTAEGGALVSPAVLQMLDRLSLVVSPMRELATVIQASGNISFPVSQRGAGTGWVAEDAARPSTTTPDITLFTPSMGEVYANPQVSQRMLEDGYINIDQFIATELAEQFAYTEGDAFINGSGTNRPKGVLAETFTDQSDALASPTGIGQWKTGAAATLHATTPLDVFANIIASLKPNYRANANWLMNRATEAVLAVVKDTTGAYMWRQAVALGTPNTFMGFGVKNDDGMPSIAANAKPVLFGDFKQYVIVDRRGVVSLRDPYSNKPYVGFYTTKRVGGGVKKVEAFKALVVKA